MRDAIDEMNALLTQQQRCGFDCQAIFDKSMQTQQLAAAQQALSLASNANTLMIPKAPTSFRTTVKTPLQLDLKIESAAKNIAGMGSYAPPSLYDFRPVEKNHTVSDVDFRTKFALPSNQDLRRHVALDQDGFMAGASIKAVTCDRYDPRQDGREDFHLLLPHTSTKTGNLNLRLHVTLDQAGLFSGDQAIREHHFRNETLEEGDRRFVLEFKPSGKGQGCVDIGTKTRPS
ncbi:hypothetical protein AeMF1_010108 [Aphanomyces euteiches]|nr:hypothetical protein AeMF1_010108 [Aphanomyces euteiches]